MTTGIVTDSTTTLLPEVAGRPDVRVVPLTFRFGEEVFTDKVDMTNEEFFARLASSKDFPTTSQPSAGAFVEAYEELSAYDDLLVLTISSELSGTYESARAASEMVDRKIEVVDSRSAEVGSGLILMEALRVIDSGGDFGEVLRAVRQAIRRCRALFAVGTLEYLERSGRIGRAQRLLGSTLDIRPVLVLEDGVISPYKRTRGRKRQLAAIAERMRPVVEEGRPIFFGHVDAAEPLRRLMEELGVPDAPVAEIGGVVGCHVGPGTYGVAHL